MGAIGGRPDGGGDVIGPPAPLPDALGTFTGPTVGGVFPPPHAAARPTPSATATSERFRIVGTIAALLSSRVVPRVLPIDAESPDPALVGEAADVLRRGGLVAFPTETVYGLGARGLHAEEVARIFVAKGRPVGHPLILHVPDEAMARSVAAVWPGVAGKLAGAFWPGPLTLVVPRAAVVPANVSGGLPTVGVRVPAHPVALAVVGAVGEPVAAPSANAHTHVSPTTAEHVVRSLGDRVDLVLDAGACRHGIESTVVDVSLSPPVVLRPGALALDRLRAIAPDIVYRPVTVRTDAPRAAPGLAAKHYAPRARIVEAAGPGVAAAVAEARRAGSRVGAITWSEAAVASDVHRPLGRDPIAYAHDLFAALYEMDAAACDVVVIESVPDEPAWWAVADRLRRAKAD
jgi:L-threonylcarbamoyladenylate synthase